LESGGKWKTYAAGWRDAEKDSKLDFKALFLRGLPSDKFSRIYPAERQKP
jgi:hypothetical protein